MLSKLVVKLIWIIRLGCRLFPERGRSQPRARRLPYRKIESNLPYGLKEGPKHWDNIKEQVAEALLNRLRQFAPNLHG